MRHTQRVAAVTLATFKEWAQTIVLVGSVVVSCVVLVFKFGGYANRIEDAIKDATALGTQAVAENVQQQKAIDVLIGAEERRQRAEDKAEAARERASRRTPVFDEWPSVRQP